MNPALHEVRALIVDYLVRVAHVPAADLSSGSVRLGDLNIDSLSAVEMLWTIEHHYDVRLPTPEAGLDSLTLDELVAQLAALASVAGTPALAEHEAGR